MKRVTICEIAFGRSSTINLEMGILPVKPKGLLIFEQTQTIPLSQKRKNERDLKEVMLQLPTSVGHAKLMPEKRLINITKSV